MFKTKSIISLILLLFLSGCGGGSSSGTQADEPEAQGAFASPGTESSLGRLERLTIESSYLNARKVDVWLPQDYDGSEDKEYKVLYVHDSQFLFRVGDCACFNSVVQLDRVMQYLTSVGSIEDTIVVGVWNGGSAARRNVEFFPENALDPISEEEKQAFIADLGGTPVGNDYLSFVVQEVMPEIESSYNVRTGPEHTSVMGFSMSGVMALYTLAEYPELFGAAAAISPWWVNSNSVDYFEHNLPDPSTHKIYIDMGNEGFASALSKFKQFSENHGYVENENYVFKEYPSHEHSPRFWRMRIEEPLMYLLQN